MCYYSIMASAFRVLMFNLASFSLCVFVRRDILRVGVTLAGHQKKILSSIEALGIQNKTPGNVLY